MNGKELNEEEEILSEDEDENNKNFFKTIFINIITFIVSISHKLNNNNVMFYMIYFFIYFFIYFAITSRYINNSYVELINKYSKYTVFKIIFYGFISISILCWLVYFGLSFSDTKNKFKQMILITSGITIMFMLFNFAQIFLIKITNKIPVIVIIIIFVWFLLYNIVFFIFYITMFIINLHEDYNIEVCVAFILLYLFDNFNYNNNNNNKKNTYQTLNDNDFNYQMMKCFVRSPTENYESQNSINNLPYIENLLSTKGNDYLEFDYNIPIKFKNPETGAMQDLTLADFYYPGSYKSYLGNTPLNGSPDIIALEKALSDYKARIVTLDIYSDIDNEFSEKANPVVTVNPENLKEGSSPLSLEECFKTINNYAWLPNNKNEIAYPFFLILEFHFDDNNDMFYEKIRNLIMKYFRKYLMSNKYDFNGHNGNNHINKAPIKECLGRLILITNKYPVGPLNELVNCSIGKEAPNNTNNAINLNEYTKSMVYYENSGLSQSESITKLTNECRTTINFYYSVPNIDYENKGQEKAGLYNPKFQDVAQYGVQSTLMYLYLPDMNLNKWYSYFLKKSNFDPVLKDETLRNILIPNKDMKPQNQTAGIGASPENISIMPGNDGKPFFEVETSNLK